MGYHVGYRLKLRIPVQNFSKALEIFNHLHTDEMLTKYAYGGLHGSYPEKKISDVKWYSWVRNPETPYKTLKEAFENWYIVDDDVEMYIDEKNQDFVIKGTYHNKLGQQDFLISQLAPVLRNTTIEVFGEDSRKYLWIVENGKYSTKSFYLLNDFESDSEDEIEKEEVDQAYLSTDNLNLAL